MTETHGGRGGNCGVHHKNLVRRARFFMEQLSLNWQAQAIQPRELARCRAVIAPLILAFCKARGVGAQFHLSELIEYVKARTPIVPDSAGRILRDMRQARELNYSVVNRRESLYQIEEA